MQSRMLNEQGGQRTYALILATGDEVMTCLQRFAEAERLSAAQLTAIGALRRAELYFFDWESKEYRSNPVDEQTEVATMIGDIACDRNGAPTLHAHVVLGRRDGAALAGHLARGEVRPTLEVAVTETPAHLRRRKDAETGLALIDLGAGAR